MLLVREVQTSGPTQVCTSHFLLRLLVAHLGSAAAPLTSPPETRAQGCIKKNPDRYKVKITSGHELLRCSQTSSGYVCCSVALLRPRQPEHLHSAQQPTGCFALLGESVNEANQRFSFWEIDVLGLLEFILRDCFPLERHDEDRISHPMVVQHGLGSASSNQDAHVRTALRPNRNGSTTPRLSLSRCMLLLQSTMSDAYQRDIRLVVKLVVLGVSGRRHPNRATKHLRLYPRPPSRSQKTDSPCLSNQRARCKGCNIPREKLLFECCRNLETLCTILLCSSSRHILLFAGVWSSLGVLEQSSRICHP